MVYVNFGEDYEYEKKKIFLTNFTIFLTFFQYKNYKKVIFLENKLVTFVEGG